MEPLTILAALAYAGLKTFRHGHGSAGTGEETPEAGVVFTVLESIAGHVTGHYAHHDVEDLRRTLHGWLQGPHPDRNQDLEKAVARAALHANLFCLMEAVGDPIDEPRGAVERWKQLIWERCPANLRAGTINGIFAYADQQRLEETKAVCLQQLRALEEHFQPGGFEIDVFRMSTNDGAYEVGLALRALEGLESKHNRLPDQAREIFKNQWFYYLRSSFHYDLKHNEPVSRIFFNEKIGKEAVETRRHVTEDGFQTRQIVTAEGERTRDHITTTVRTVVTETQKLATAGIGLALAEVRETVVGGKIAAEESREILDRLAASANRTDKGDLERDKLDYLNAVDRYVASVSKEQLEGVVLREVSGARLSLSDLFRKHRQFLLFTADPASTARLLMAASRAQHSRIIGDGTIPLRIALGRRLEHHSLNDLLLSTVDDSTMPSSAFLPFLREELEGGRTLLIFEAPNAGEVSSETLRWISDELAKGVASQSRSCAILRFGKNLQQPIRTGWPTIIQSYSVCGVPNLNLTLHLISENTRDPVVQMPGQANISCRIGASWSIALRTNDDCYLTLFLKGTTGNCYRVFLSPRHSEAFVRGGALYSIPQSGDEFWFEESGPPGTEVIQAFATREPMDLHFSNRTEAEYLATCPEECVASFMTEFARLSPAHRAYAQAEIAVLDS